MDGTPPTSVTPMSGPSTDSDEAQRPVATLVLNAVGWSLRIIARTMSSAGQPPYVATRQFHERHGHSAFTANCALTTSFVLSSTHDWVKSSTNCTFAFSEWSTLKKKNPHSLPPSICAASMPVMRPLHVHSLAPDQTAQDLSEI